MDEPRCLIRCPDCQLYTSRYLGPPRCPQYIHVLIEYGYVQSWFGSGGSLAELNPELRWEGADHNTSLKGEAHSLKGVSARWRSEDTKILG